MALRLVNVVSEAASTVYRRLVVAKGREGIARGDEASKLRV